MRFGGRRTDEFAVSVVGCPIGDYQRAFECRGLTHGERSGLETPTWNPQREDHLRSRGANGRTQGKASSDRVGPRTERSRALALTPWAEGKGALAKARRLRGWRHIFIYV